MTDVMYSLNPHPDTHHFHCPHCGNILTPIMLMDENKPNSYRGKDYVCHGCKRYFESKKIHFEKKKKKRLLEYYSEQYD